MMKVLELDKVTLFRGGVAILKDVSVSIPEGKTTVIIGPAGCGKSSLLKTIAGLLDPQKGTVKYNGMNYKDFNDKELLSFRKTTGFVFQDSALWANRSVHENLSLPIILHNPDLPEKEVASRVNELIRQVGFWDNPNLRPAQISSGERKLISFARGICNSPYILFLDFPTSGVDTINARKLEKIIEAYKADGKTICMTTHESKPLAQFADYLIALDKGEIVASGQYPQILREGNDRLKEIISDVIESDQARAEGDDLLDLMNTGD